MLRSDIKKATEFITELKEENLVLYTKLKESHKQNKVLSKRLQDLERNIEELININDLLKTNLVESEKTKKFLQDSLQKIREKSLITKEKNLQSLFKANRVLKSQLYSFTPNNKRSELQGLSKELIEGIKSNLNLEMIFKSFSSFTDFSEEIYNVDYASALKTLISFAKVLVCKEENEEFLIDEIKRENDRIEALKQELDFCVKKNMDVLTPNKSFHSRVTSYNSTTIAEDVGRDKLLYTKNSFN